METLFSSHESVKMKKKIQNSCFCDFRVKKLKIVVSSHGIFFFTRNLLINELIWMSIHFPDI